MSKRIITKANYRVHIHGTDGTLRLFIFEPDRVEIADYEYWSVSCEARFNDDVVLQFNTVGVSTLQALSTTLWLLMQQLRDNLALHNFDWAAGDTDSRTISADDPRTLNRAVPIGETYVAALKGDEIEQFCIQMFAPSVIHEGVRVALTTPGLAGESSIEATNGLAALVEGFRHVHELLLDKFDGTWQFRLGDDSPVSFEAFQSIYFGAEHSPLRCTTKRPGMSTS